MLLMDCDLKSVSNEERIQLRIVDVILKGNLWETNVSDYIPIYTSDETDKTTFYDGL